MGPRVERCLYMSLPAPTPFSSTTRVSREYSADESRKSLVKTSRKLSRASRTVLLGGGVQSLRAVEADSAVGREKLVGVDGKLAKSRAKDTMGSISVHL